MGTARAGWAAAAWLVASAGCGPAEQAEQRVSRATGGTEVERERLAALVDGVPIYTDEVAELARRADGGMSPDEALEALVRSELLAAEAERRGHWVHSDVEAARRSALARAVLRREVEERVRTDTVGEQLMRRYYDEHKHLFVHGPMRRVVNIVVLTGEKGIPEDEARAAANELAAAARDAGDDEAFESLAAPFRERHGKKVVRVERLPPFDAERARFVAPFVKAAFDVPEVGRASPAFSTKFGWHVLFVVEELPGKNVSFEEAREEIAAGMVPGQRSNAAFNLLKGVLDETDIRIHEAAVEQRGEGAGGNP